MKTLYLDIFSGISGDMFVGALLDLGVPLDELEAELRKLKLDGWHLHAGRQQKAGIAGVKFDVHLEHEHCPADGTTPRHLPDHGAGTEAGHAHGHSHSYPDHGTHGGPLIEISGGRVELSVFETGVPPRFRLFFQDSRGKPTQPPAPDTVVLETVRPDRKRQTFAFMREKDYLEATTLLPEPHEFRVVLKLKRGSKAEKHESRFVEDHHHHDHHHDHGRADDGSHGHGRNFSQIRELIRRSRLSDWVKEKSIAVFHRVAVAEGKIHGRAPEEVHFHEVGAVDSIIDIVGACVALELLGRPRVLSAPVVEGMGWIRCAHGRFPLPAPATLEILGVRGIALTQCEEPGELVTPTGAALLAEFAEGFEPMRGIVATKVGYGLGTRDNRTRPNVLRAVLGEAAAPGRAGHDWETDTVAVIETNLDDVSPEVLGHFVERALAEGALDVFHTAIQMKKNRPGVLLTVLCAPDRADDFSELLLRETSAFGVRRTLMDRRKLKRESVTVKTRFGPVSLKIGRLDGKTVQAAPEFETCRELAAKAGVPVKAVFEAAARARKDS